jgi:hypothetical protein
MTEWPASDSWESPTVNVRGAGALVAALLGARQVEPFAQYVEQALARIDFRGVLAVIDRQMHCSGDPGELAVGDVHASTIPLKWMIEHHIIYTIPASITGRRGSLRYARQQEDDVAPEQRGSFFATRRRAMI